MARVLAIFLDGYEHSLGQRLMSAGEMPEMSRLADSSARFVLDYGPAQRTGLAGEHVATGLSPEAAQRWSAVHFDPRSYQVWQEGTRLRPFAADLDARTVVFDVPYFDLEAAPAVNGIVAWGAHDPGVAQASRPGDLASELQQKFGAYPASRWIYGFAWPSVRRSGAMGRDLARAVDVRAEAAHWLLAERLPDWDLALVAVSESHSVIEALWHGIDPAHPLHQLPGADAAQRSIHAVYRAIDRLVGRLTSAFPDALPVVFSMGGMGDNRSDLPSMLLLPELMYRQAFKTPLFKQPREWAWSTDGAPVLLSDTDAWGNRMAEGFLAPSQPRLRRLASRMLPSFVKSLLRGAPSQPEIRADPARISLNWMPAAAYRPFWHAMPAFALPSYYDGRVRVNLKGREARGIVERDDYQRVLADVERAAREAIDPATGKSAVDYVEHTAPHDPRDLAETQADLVFVWKGAAASLEHPSLGRIGPVPYRRTGGHTGPSGVAYIRARGLPAGERGTRSAFDVVPTIMDLLGQPRDPSLSGEGLLGR
jgi:predicted AlkP superfamily phosphohydrolase/phosphomutase